MQTIEKLYRSMGECPCCQGPPELCVWGGFPREVFIRCRVCGLHTRTRRVSSTVRPMKGMEGAPMSERFDASERRQTIRLAFRAIADWNRRPPGVRLCLAIGPDDPRTDEGAPVRVGQVWRSLDKRRPVRHVKVMAISAHRCGLERSAARVIRCHPDGTTPPGARPPVSTLSVDRMHKHGTGWKLVR